MLFHEVEEPISVESRVHTRKGVSSHVSVLQDQPLGFQLLSLVVLLQEVNDSNAIIQVLVLLCLVLNEVLSP